MAAHGTWREGAGTSQLATCTCPHMTLTLVPFQGIRTAHTALVATAKDVHPEMQARTRDTHNPPTSGTGTCPAGLGEVPVTDTQLNCSRTQKQTHQTVSDDSRALYAYSVHSRIFLPLCAPVRQYGLRDAPRVGRHFVTCTHVTR